MDLIERMKSQEGNFTESELAVARYIAGHPMDVVGNTVSKVSELSGLSAAAIVRMCQRMGYSGFSEFRFEMDRQILSNGTLEKGGTSEDGLLSRFVNINAVQLRKVAEAVDASLLNHVAASLCNAPRVAVWGVDRMYERALQLSAGLMHVGIFNSVTNDTTVMDPRQGRRLRGYLAEGLRLRCLCSAHGCYSREWGRGLLRYGKCPKPVHLARIERNRAAKHYERRAVGPRRCPAHHLHIPRDSSRRGCLSAEQGGGCQR